MGLSIRAREWVRKEALRRIEERERELAAELDAATKWHAEFLDRERTAAFLGIKPRTLKKYQLAGTIPPPVKFGDHRQSRVAWRRSDLERYAADPKAWGSANRNEGQPDQLGR
jgi:predicted DNA-binding transcriptional regulator AlpA